MSDDTPTQVNLQKHPATAENTTVGGGNIWSPETESPTPAPRPIYRGSLLDFNAPMVGVLVLGAVPIVLLALSFVVSNFHELATGGGWYLGK